MVDQNIDENIDDHNEDTNVDEGTSHEEEGPVRYNVSSHGWDTDTEGLVKRLNRNGIVVPSFQRKFIWNRSDKSRFIESLIIGLPIPSIFLAADPTTKKMNIIDGQQRLLTLQEYFAGNFSLRAPDIQDDLNGCYYDQIEGRRPRKVLNAEDRRTLEDALIHAVVIKQETPDESDASINEFSDAILQIFKRLNTTGRPLQAQEVRACVFYGELNQLLGELNQLPAWRSLFGAEHSRLKDVEAILRFFALFNNHENYRAPMPRFLNEFMRDNRNLSNETCEEMRVLFSDLVEKLLAVFGEGVFKQGNTFLLSRFDAVMFGLAKRTDAIVDIGQDDLKQQFQTLLDDEQYQWSVDEFINDTNRVEARLDRAETILA